MGFLTSLFGALSAVKEIIQTVKAIIDFVDANKKEAWFQESAEVFRELRKAETSEDRKKMALKLRDLLRSM